MVETAATVAYLAWARLLLSYVSGDLSCRVSLASTSVTVCNVTPLPLLYTSSHTNIRIRQPSCDEVGTDISTTLRYLGTICDSSGKN